MRTTRTRLRDLRAFIRIAATLARLRPAGETDEQESLAAALVILANNYEQMRE